jgi:hypothetical protein
LKEFAINALTFFTRASCALLVLASATAAAQAPAATRSVSHYLEREQALQQAIIKGAQPRLSELLDDELEVRSSASPETLSRAQWLAMPVRPSAAARIRDLAIYETEGMAVVSFLLEEPGAKAGPRKTPTWFVVDVWRQSSGKLLTRQMAVVANAPPVRTRPDGRQ